MLSISFRWNFISTQPFSEECDRGRAYAEQSEIWKTDRENESGIASSVPLELKPIAKVEAITDSRVRMKSFMLSARNDKYGRPAS